MKDTAQMIAAVMVATMSAITLALIASSCQTQSQTVNFGSGMIDRYDYSSETYTNGPVIEVDRDQHVIRVWPAGWKVIQL